jgi:hypothetical protein
MNARNTSSRPRSLRRVSLRRVQSGFAARGVVVAVGLVAAVVLQLAGPRLQCRLADLVGAGAPHAVPAAAPAPMPACGTTESDAAPMRPCKVATMAAADVAVGPQF